MPLDYDEDEFNDFLGKIEDVDSIIKGLAAGTVEPESLDVYKQEEKLKKEYAAKEAKKAKAKAEAEAKAAAAAAERQKKEEFREANKEKLEELKQNYYLRKARRERWLEFREQNRSRAFSDYYKGWDLFEEDPDEELFQDQDNPAAVQDQAAFDAMAQDIEKRTKERQGSKAAGDKERERGNLAFKAGQYSEAVAAYTRAIDHFRGDKAAHSNRAAAHIKLRNFLSALDDCSRVFDIAMFLDNDHEHRPPPPPVLKAYVRRAAANSELGRYDDAAADLATALAMAPENEKGEIKRQQKALKEETSAAKAEEKALAEHEKATSGGDGGDGNKASRERVRELLDSVRASAVESVAELSAILDAANMLEEAEKEGGEVAAEARARAANAALRRGKSEERAGKALEELTNLTRDSTACRIVLRQAGGIQTLLSLMDQTKMTPPAAATAAAASENGEGEKTVAAATDEAAAAARALWTVHVGKLLCLACTERKNQLEVHMCGGTSQLLRELRKVVSLDTPDDEAKEAAIAASYASLAPQLLLLAMCCGHETVAAELRRLAAGEGTVERLLLLLQSKGSHDAMPASSQELLVGSMALLSALCGGQGAKPKQMLLPHVTPICQVLSTHVLAKHIPLAEKAATAFGSLSSHPTFRKEMVNNASKSGLSSLLQLLPTCVDADAEDCLLPNALAALHNCSLHPDALPLIATEETASCLIPKLKSGTPTTLVRRAAAVIAKCAVRHSRVIDLLMKDKTALPTLIAAMVSEGAAHDAAENAPRVVDVTDEESSAPATAASGQEAIDAAAEAEEAAATEEEMVGSAVRILTACANRTEAATLICEKGGLPPLVKLLQRSDVHLQGNAALCIGECAKEERCLAVLAVQPVIAPLLSIAHNQKGQSCKNAAIALGRLAKNPRCLQAIRDNHGIEILARAMKGQMGNMAMG